MIETVKREIVIFNAIEDGVLKYKKEELHHIIRLLQIRKFVCLWCKKNFEKINPYGREPYNGSYEYDMMELFLEDKPIPKIRTQKIFEDEEIFYEIYYKYSDVFKEVAYLAYMTGINFTYGKPGNTAYAIYSDVMANEIKRFRKYYQSESLKLKEPVNYKSFDIHPEYICTHEETCRLMCGDADIIIKGIGSFKTHHKFHFDHAVEKEKGTKVKLTYKKDMVVLTFTNEKRVF